MYLLGLRRLEREAVHLRDLVLQDALDELVLLYYVQADEARGLDVGLLHGAAASTHILDGHGDGV